MRPALSEGLLGGRFQIGARVGQGGGGTVFRGRDVQTGDSVAIKLLGAENVLEDAASFERFEREGEALRRLNHPNIVTFLAALAEGERRYLVMEWVNGGSLAELVKPGAPSLPIDRILTIALDLSDALARSHRLDIIHRDIKPANVLLADDGTPRLTDFGVARVVGETSLTLPNTVLGTLDYLCPEVLKGETADSQADIWAFGVLLFEMLTRRRPFAGAHFAETLFGIAHGAPPDLRALRADCPVALAELIEGMLEKDRERRIASVRQVSTELENILLGRGRSPRSSGPDDPDSVSPNAATAPLELPAETTPFIGRERELAELARLLFDANVRLVTILAPGGMGKSRFAVEAGRRALSGSGRLGRSPELKRFADGAFFVSLAPLESPDLVLGAIAEAIGLRFHRAGEPRKQLLGYVRNKAMLLVMDNFEHVLESAGLIDDILRSAPHVTVVATSRERLGLSGETLFELGGMQVPHAEVATESPSAVDLFVTYARRVKPDLALSAEISQSIERICRLVGGMPLGIVLAASWAGALDPREIADEVERNLDFLDSELRDLPERQRSLRAAFDYSWKLLDESERTTLARLCVFRGGFSRTAAETVAEATVRTLATVTHKSLLRRNPRNGRYEMHEVVRQFAAEKLRESATDHERTLDRHSDYYADFLAQRRERLSGRKLVVAALDEIETEMDNVRAAWRRMLEQKNLTNVDKTHRGLEVFYDYRATFIEGEAAFRAAADALDAPRDTLTKEHARLLGGALLYQGNMSANRGHHRRALELERKAVTLFDENLHKEELAYALLLCGISNLAFGDRRQTTADLERAVALSRSTERPLQVAWSLMFLGNVQAWVGDYAKAEGPLRESIAVIEQTGGHFVLQTSIGTDAMPHLRALSGMAAVHTGQGNYEEALRLLSRTGMTEEQSDKPLKLDCLLRLAETHQALGNYAEAETFARSCATVAEELGASEMVAWAWLCLGDISKDQERYAEAASFIEKALALSNEPEARRRAGIARIRLGELALQKADYARAEALFSQDLAWFEEHEIVTGVVTALDGLGLVACETGDAALAGERLERALSIALSCKAYPLANRVAVSIATLLVRTRRIAAAVEILSRVRSDSATAHHTRIHGVEPLLAKLAIELPPREFEAALERGKGLDLAASARSALLQTPG